jgi:hypothetical protein
MKLASDMSVEEFAAHLKKQREALFDANDRHDVNRRWRNPKWRSSVISAHTARIAMKRRSSNRLPNG